MMKNRIKLIILAMAASIGLSNCIDVHQVVNVKKDGSGTIEETMLITMPPELAALGGDQDPIADLMKGNKMKDRANGMGEGVEFVDAKPFDGKNGAKGVKITFKFADISTVKLSGDAGLATMNPDPNAKAPAATDDKVMTFGFEKGDKPKLTIKTPPMDGVDGMDQDIDPTQMAMMSQFMKGMRIRVSVKPDGEITKTNATYSEDGSVTLIDFEMDKLFKDPAKFKAFSQLAKEKDRTKVAAKIKELDIKAETQEKVTVEFK
ncbi:MAG: hypothetical protein ACI8XO_003080 [Verrucomicrobiales bacterium]|jgi:hypothetical protein